MPAKQKLYIIRGTGLAIDGVIVEVIKNGVDGFSLIHPYNNKKAAKAPFMIDDRYLQPIDDSIVFVKYEFTVKKSGSEECLKFVLDDCPRNVSLESIKDFIASNLGPILKME